tara:strand:+ start:85 stop:267 length:183 start_codon:yes stop_codon:yes gene_type:complete
MSCQQNEILQENILMGVLGMDRVQIEDELGLPVSEMNTLDYDTLVDKLVEKRFEEDPRQV